MWHESHLLNICNNQILCIPNYNDTKRLNVFFNHMNLTPGVTSEASLLPIRTPSVLNFSKLSEPKLH